MSSLQPVLIVWPGLNGLDNIISHSSSLLSKLNWVNSTTVVSFSFLAVIALNLLTPLFEDPWVTPALDPPSPPPLFTDLIPSPAKFSFPKEDKLKIATIATIATIARIPYEYSFFILNPPFLYY